MKCILLKTLSCFMTVSLIAMEEVAVRRSWRTDLLSEYGEVFRVATAATWPFSVAFLAIEVSMSEEKSKPGWILKNSNVLITACMKCSISFLTVYIVTCS